MLNGLADQIARSKYPLLLIAMAVFGFHLYDIFIIKTMYVDDHHRLILGLENRLHETIYMRNKLRAFTMQPLYELLSIDPVWARLAQVVVYYIPLAISVFMLVRRFGDLSRGAAIAVAIVPCVLPGQWMLPSFIDGSYTIQGMLVFNLSLYAALHYASTSSDFRPKWIVLVAVLYGASLEMMDHSVFLMPVAVFILLAMFYRDRNLRPFLAMAAVFIGLGIAKAIHAFFFPTVGASTTISPSLAIFIQRFSSFGETIFPFSHWINSEAFDYRITVGIFSLIVSWALVIGSMKDRVIILTALLWAFCSSIVFLTISKYYAPRYGHIAGFGVNLALIQSIFLLLKRYLAEKRHFNKVFLGLVAFTIVYSGLVRIENLQKRHESLNEVHEGIVNELKLHGFPLNAQVVMIDGGRIPIGGWWHYARGYIKYVTRRADLDGLVGWENFYYNPFDVDKRGFNEGHQMNGLNIDRATFFFSLKACYPDRCVFEQHDMVLKFEEEHWTLLKYDLCSGEHKTVVEGVGREGFNKSLIDLGLSTDEILFAN